MNGRKAKEIRKYLFRKGVVIDGIPESSGEGRVRFASRGRRMYKMAKSSAFRMSSGLAADMSCDGVSAADIFRSTW